MTRYTICTPTADIIADPENSHVISKNDSQMLFGETFHASKEQDDWVYGSSDIDGYSGYIYKAQLMPFDDELEPTHIVDVRQTHIYPAPDFKTPPLMPLSFLSQVYIDKSRLEHGFVPVNDMGWVFAAHFSPVNTVPKAQDLADTALLYLHTPYLYGGRSSLGIDCSGLIQNTLLRHGIKCPRDSGDQEKALGKQIDKKDLKRGDLVFFKGHVGIMMDSKNILNATARHMCTLIEPLNDLIPIYGDIISAKTV